MDFEQERDWTLFYVLYLVTQLRHRDGDIKFPFTVDQLVAMNRDDLLQIKDGLLELSRVPPKKG